MACEICQEIKKTCIGCDMRAQDKTTWESMQVKDKVNALTYKRLVISGKVASHDLINAVNQIHDKYPDFHIGVVP
jgi:hypothetical protein